LPTKGRAFVALADTELTPDWVFQPEHASCLITLVRKIADSAAALVMARQ
jgi:hypothetical protein